jgi:nucleotide-binding universal stress UspA family protein
MPIVAAVDRSGPNDQVLEEAQNLADGFGDEVHVVHVLSQKEFREIEQTSIEETGTTVPMDEVRSLAKEVADEAAEGVVDTYHPVGLVGDAADELVDYVEKNDARYIVVGGQKRSPVGKALFGSVTQSVLLSAPCPVVAVIQDKE